MTADKEKWYHHIWFIVTMLLAVGPFAFPLLWKSDKVSLQMKWVLTILFSILTILAIWFSIETVKLILKQARELQGILY